MGTYSLRPQTKFRAKYGHLFTLLVPHVILNLLKDCASSLCDTFPWFGSGRQRFVVYCKLPLITTLFSFSQGVDKPSNHIVNPSLADARTVIRL